MRDSSPRGLPPWVALIIQYRLWSSQDLSITYASITSVRQLNAADWKYFTVSPLRARLRCRYGASFQRNSRRLLLACWPLCSRWWYESMQNLLLKGLRSHRESLLSISTSFGFQENRQAKHACLGQNLRCEGYYSLRRENRRSKSTSRTSQRTLR